MKFVTLLIMIATLAAGAAGEAPPLSGEATVTIEGTTVTFVGGINEQNVDLFLKTVEGKDLETLIITSGGGAIDAGMRMGTWVFDHGIDVVVETMCMSSCANYVFTAGRNKTIRPGAIVAWHGSILQGSVMSDDEVRRATLKAYGDLPEDIKKMRTADELVEQAIRQAREYEAENTIRQTEFFQKIDVDARICLVGNEDCGAADFFTLSVKDMARFGVQNVTAPDDYNQTDLSPFQKPGKTVEHVTLEDGYE